MLVLRYRYTLLTLACCVALGLGFVYSALPVSLPAQSISARLLDNTIYDAGEVSYYLLDEGRETAANGAFSGLDHRPLDTRIWYPMVEGAAVAPGRHPLLLFSHGFFSGKEEGAYLAQFLARHGYIVAAVDFPLTQIGAPGGATASDVMNQPGDISFVIDTLLAWDQQADSLFYQRIDHARLAALGVSLGGLTSALLMYHPELRDDRIKFGVAVAAPLAGLELSWLSRAEAPFMVIAAEQDTLVNYQRHTQWLVDSLPSATLVTLNAASHTGFSGFSRYLRWLPDPDWVTCTRVRSRLAQDPVLARLLLDVSSSGSGRGSSPLPEVCQTKAGELMNPLRQQWITALAVYNFVQQQFADSRAEVAFAGRYLHDIMPAEFADSVTVNSQYSALVEVSQRDYR